MDVMLILGILSLIFFVSLLLMCIYRYKMNFKVINTVFILANFFAFSCWTYAGYEKGWIDSGWLTLGNISPLMFTMILLAPFLKEKVAQYIYSAISMLSLGMFIALFISPGHSYVFNFNHEANFLYTGEATCHMICSLYGIFLVFAGRVKANFEHWVKGAIFLYSVITLGVILNFVYHKNHFGMDPYGNAKIYMIDIFGGFWSTLAAYYFGIAIVLTVGMQVMALIDRGTAKLHTHHNKTDEEGATYEETSDPSLVVETEMIESTLIDKVENEI